MSILRTRILVFLLPLMLAACGPLNVYFRDGVSQARLDRDLLACEVKALKEAPVAAEIRHRPPVFYPGRRVCNSEGHCWTTPGHWVDGGSYTVDVNRALRGRIEQSCMAQKGYQQLALPRCTNTLNLPPQPLAQTPLRLDGNSCAIQRKNGTVQIVTYQ
ncbi:hypothetical protein RSK20926_18637 [Roseobacter sp. SK209-2-6]|uniref:hypothetical protein n=1 Tax=Roseobacter sp. SK209-2-6 TaxID=388739 RepID=UPI0000F3F779|nr:hypothetical protein [Roseobacter sp. SK209-2-6]EBA17784.1 hypothetical protein RSK20926_18637 [Roseobacter sp. SK209-2-6]